MRELYLNNSSDSSLGAHTMLVALLSKLEKAGSGTRRVPR